ncbi:MAG: DUF2306 domain-containing protein [Lysobacterales bacterium]
MPPTASQRALSLGARLWFVGAAAGQTAFAAFILAFVLPRLAAGDLPGLNDKPHLTGYQPGDAMGNIQLIAHLLLGALMTVSGLLQLLPALRRRWPALHRWNGRLFLLSALITTLSGFYLTWIRGSQLNLGSALSTSANGVLILLALAFAWQAARQRDFAAHRRHALRAFLLVNGVWFLRLGMVMTGTLMAAGGKQLEVDGPVFLAVSLLSWALPLALLELYLLAERSPRAGMRFAVAGVLAGAALLTTAAGLAAWLFLWSPRL